MRTIRKATLNVDESIDTSFGEDGVITTSSDDDRWMEHLLELSRLLTQTIQLMYIQIRALVFFQ